VTGTLGTTSSGAGPVRADVLGYPSPTTSRYLLLAAALLASGLFVGNFAHHWLLGDSWERTVAVCQNRYGGGGTVAQLLAENRGFNRCTAGVERRRVAVTVAGSLVEGGAAVVLLWVAPLAVRRRRGLRPLPAQLAGASTRFAELAAEAGVGARAAPLIGRAVQRDAFSFGAPGRYRVALPPAVVVRWRDGAVFDPLVRHECAHIAHRDVALAWLTRLVWAALAPLLALPVVVGVVTGDRSVLVSYTWRTALLAVAVVLLSSALLRSREHGADIRAARSPGDPERLAGLVRRTSAPDLRLPRRLLARHPSTAQRVEVIDDPSLVTRTGFLDGFTGAFLAALAVPLLVATVSPLLAPSGHSNAAYAVAAAVMGPMLAGSVGLGLWRRALFARLRDEHTGGLSAALGVGVGFVLGQAVSLQQAGVGSLTGLREPAWVLASGLAGAGAALVADGLAQVWADATPRLPGMRAAWMTGLLLSSLAFSSALWASTLFQTAVDGGGWALGRAVLLSSLSTWQMLLIVLGLAAAAAVGLGLRPAGAGSPVPEWLQERPRAVPWPVRPALPVMPVVRIGVVAGLVGAVSMAVYRLAAGPVGRVATYDRFLGYEWLAALMAGVAVAVLVVAHPLRGAGAALLAGPCAVAVVLVGFLALNTALGGTPDAALAASFARPATVLGFYATLAVAPLAATVQALASRWRPAALPQAAGVAVVATAVFAAAVAPGALAIRGFLVGDGRYVVAGWLRQGAADRESALRTEFSAYLRLVPTVGSVLGSTSSAAQSIWSDPSTDGPDKVSATRARVVAPLAELLSQLRRFPTGAPEVTALHAELVAAVSAALRSYAVLLRTGGSPRAADVAAFRLRQAEEARHLRAWREMRVDLARRLTRATGQGPTG
jgi:hypothetical protein